MFLINRAYISFTNLMKLQAGRSIVEKHLDNARFQKAVNEMEFCLNMADWISMRRSKQTHSPFGAGDTMQPNSAEPTVALVHREESVPNKKTTKSKGPKPVNQIQTRSKNRSSRFPINDGDALQPSSTDQNDSFRSGKRKRSKERTSSFSQPVSRVCTRSQNTGPNGLTDADGALHPYSTELTVSTVAKSSLSIAKQKRRREPNDQTMSNLEIVHRIQTRSQKLKKL